MKKDKIEKFMALYDDCEECNRFSICQYTCGFINCKNKIILAKKQGFTDKEIKEMLIYVCKN